MKRLGAGLVGLFFGLVFTWACLYVGQFIDWHPLRKVAWLHAKHKTAGCWDLEHCPNAPWWIYLFFFLLILGPAIIFFALNFFAWKRWSLARWFKWKALISILLMAIYFLGAIT